MIILAKFSKTSFQYINFEVQVSIYHSAQVNALIEVNCMAEKNAIEIIAAILVIIGGINWGLYAFNMNLVKLIFGSVSILENIVYVLVALSAIFMAYMYFKQ